MQPPSDHALCRIAIFGVESTGKSTLAESLGRHYGAPVALEYVREFWDAHGDVVASDLEQIACGQMANEDAAEAAALAQWARRVLAAPTAAAAARLPAPLIICDTELLTNQLYDELLFPGAKPAWLSAEAERRSRRYALYLLCDTDIPYEADPQRGEYDSQRRAQWRQLWRETLVSCGLPFVDIRGSWPQRLQRAIAAIDALL